MSIVERSFNGVSHFLDEGDGEGGRAKGARCLGCIPTLSNAEIRVLVWCFPSLILPHETSWERNPVRLTWNVGTQMMLALAATRVSYINKYHELRVLHRVTPFLIPRNPPSFVNHVKIFAMRVLGFPRDGERGWVSIPYSGNLYHEILVGCLGVP